MPRVVDATVVSILLCLAAGGCGGADRPRSHNSADAAPAPPAGSTAIGGESVATGPNDSARDGATGPDRELDRLPAESAGTRDPSFDTVLAPIHDVQVFARLDGEVVQLAVEEGQRVAAGATLARLDDRERKARLAEREAEVQRAEAAWGRAQKLRTEQVISDEEYIGARSDWEISKARRDQAKIEEDRCTVQSPIGGIVSLRRVQVGQLLKDGDLMFRVSDPSRLRAELLLPESYLGRVRAGQHARLVTTVGSVVDARVTRVNPIVDPASGTFRVVIDVDNRRLHLPSGVSAHVDLGLGSTAREP